MNSNVFTAVLSVRAFPNARQSNLHRGKPQTAWFTGSKQRWWQTNGHMFVRRSFYRIIRRMKTFEKDIFHPSSKRNSFLGMIVTFDCSTSGKIFTRQVMAVLQLHAEAEVTSFRRKKEDLLGSQRENYSL